MKKKLNTIGYSILYSVLIVVLFVDYYKNRMKLAFETPEDIPLWEEALLTIIFFTIGFATLTVVCILLFWIYNLIF